MGRKDFHHLSLRTILEFQLELIKVSGNGLTAWSGSNPQIPFWNWVRSGLIYSPENGAKWNKWWHCYKREVWAACREGITMDGVNMMERCLSSMGVAGDWQEFQSGLHLLHNQRFVPALRENLILRFLETDNENPPRELRRMERIYYQMMETAHGDEFGKKLIQDPTPVLIPLLREPSKLLPLFSRHSHLYSVPLRFGYGKDSTTNLSRLLIRSPWGDPCPWLRSIYPDDIDTKRKVSVHPETDPQVTIRIQEVLRDAWGLSIEVKPLESDVGFEQCRTKYELRPYAPIDLRRDIREGKVINIFDESLSNPISVFSFEETNELD